MFTGLVESLGRVAAVVAEPPGVRLVVEAVEIAKDAQLGESICTSGCCLSVVRIDGPRLEFQLGPETLTRTSLGQLAAGKPVNLERSLRLSDRLGGHLVTGHIDGQGRLESRVQEGDWVTCRFSAPPALRRQMALLAELRPKAVQEAGVSRLPDGEAYYALALQARTTTTMSPAAVHKVGLDVTRARSVTTSAPVAAASAAAASYNSHARGAMA